MSMQNDVDDIALVERFRPVLLVESYQPMIAVLRSLLAQIGFHDVDAAEDGVAALRLLRQTSYAVVIAEMNVAPHGGVQLLRQLRRAGGDGAPFILLAAQPSAEDIVAAKKAGVSQILIKPFSARALKDNIERAMRAAP